MRYFSIMLIFASVAGFSLSASADTKNVTVKECVSLALQNNPDIRILVEDENRSLADYKMIKGNDSLSVNLVFQPQMYDKSTGTNMGTTTPAPGQEYYFYPSFNLVGTYPLYTPGNGKRTIIARKNVDIAKLQGKKGRDDIVLGVKTLYYGLIRANKIVKLRGQIKKNYENRLASVKVYVQRGDRPVIDQSSAEVALSQVTLELRAAENAEKTLLAELKVQLGLLSDAPDVQVEDFPKLPDLKYDLDQIYSLVDSYSTDVVIAGIRTEQARLAIAASREQHLPTVSVMAGLTYANKEVNLERTKSYGNTSSWQSMYVMGATAVLNLYSGGRISAASDAAAADYNKSIFYQRKVLINSRKNGKSYFQRLKELKEQISIGRLNIENSRTNLLLTQRSFDSGIVNQLVVQNAEMGFLQTEMSLIDAQYEYFRTLATLSNLIGLEEEFLCGAN